MGWQFNFMGAGIDAYDQGARMGLSAVNTVSYDAADPAATMAVFSDRAARTQAFARGAEANMEFTPQEKRAAKDRFDPSNKKPAEASKPRSSRRAIVDDIRL